MPSIQHIDFCGTDQQADELGGADPTKYSADPNSGPTAVIRNLDAVLPPRQDGVYHVVVTDRFYTSVQLALQLLNCHVYIIGTIQTNKKGFPPTLITDEVKRPAGTPRGTAVVASAKACPQLQALLLWDRLPVYLLSRGSSSAVETCGRRIPGGRRSTIPCPSAMREYHRWMGGVDIHDQLRLQRYSLQLSVRCRKYYKTIFFGLIDMGIVNAFMVYRWAWQRRGDAPADHAKFLEQLQMQLVQVSSDDFLDEVYLTCLRCPSTPSSVAVSGEHKLTEFPEWIQVREGIRKRPQHQCKVCSIRKEKVDQRSATRFYCEACSDGKKR
ncbi:unnamed protein product [Phytophthora fragariaefolia]|uniref:Unnamed protein product n=1 Tax=Phytophthora fragariaefolia TaxID=1490495 RepID=A0A9W6YGF2_9STRA|nr:unnamed protein product [Phytophthora fragariaefolia]